MKRFFILALLLLFPFTAFAGTLKADKTELLQLALKEKEAALAEMYRLENMVWYLPDLADREHLKTIIAASIAAVAAPSPYAKVLSVGLALIGGIANQMYDKYHDMRTCMILADHHSEMSQFYRMLSYQVPDSSGATDKGTLDFFRAINFLTLATMTAHCIPENDVKFPIIEELDRHMKYFLARKANMASKAEILRENIDEILTECDEENLKIDISNHLELVADYMDSAERFWKKNS
jgi:hypothetical protein